MRSSRALSPSMRLRCGMLKDITKDKRGKISMTVFDTAKFATLLKSKRGKKTLRTAADEIGTVSKATIARIERGYYPIDMETFLHLCDWLGVAPATFFPSKNTHLSWLDQLEQVECLLHQLRIEDDKRDAL